MREDIIGLLFEIGLSPRYSGYRYIISAVLEVLGTDGVFSMMEIYEKIVSETKTSSYSAERCMRTAIGNCWEYGNKEKLKEVFGTHQKDRPSNAHFVATLAAYIQYKR